MRQNFASEIRITECIVDFTKALFILYILHSAFACQISYGNHFLVEFIHHIVSFSYSPIRFHSGSYILHLLFISLFHTWYFIRYIHYTLYTVCSILYCRVYNTLKNPPITNFVTFWKQEKKTSKLLVIHVIDYRWNQECVTR